MSFPLNSAPRFTARWFDADDAAADPTTLTVAYTNPAGTTTTKTYGTDVVVVRSSVGVYYIDITLTSVGVWTIVWTATGDVTATIIEEVVVGGPTAADWVAEAEQYLTAGARESRNTLAADVATSDTTLTFSYDLGGIVPGARISVDLEDMYVLDTDSTAKTAVVDRADNGSSAAAHSSGARVYVNPKNSKFSILRAINADLVSLHGAGLFHMATVDVTYNPSTVAYDLVGISDIDDIYKVEAKVTGLTGDWRPIGSNGYHLDREASRADFPSGFSLSLSTGGQSGQAVRVHYKQPFVALNSLTSDVSTSLLPSSAYDIPPIGAAARLITPREVGRNDTTTQGDTRRAEEVPARAVASSAADLWRLWERYVGRELLTLQRRYPVLSSAWS